MIKAETMERNVTLDFVRGVAILGILLLTLAPLDLLEARLYLIPPPGTARFPEDARSSAILDIVAQVVSLRCSRCCLARGYKCCFRVVNSGFSRAFNAGWYR